MVSINERGQVTMSNEERLYFLFSSKYHKKINLLFDVVSF